MIIRNRLEITFDSDLSPYRTIWKSTIQLSNWSKDREGDGHLRALKYTNHYRYESKRWLGLYTTDYEITFKYADNNKGADRNNKGNKINFDLTSSI